MRSSIILGAAFASTALTATTTMTPVNQMPDGQIQAPATSTLPSYVNPFTSYLTMTNSQGVVTGMASVWTSQPPVVTSQPALASWSSLNGWDTTMLTTTPSVSLNPVAMSTTMITSSSSRASTTSAAAAAATTSTFSGAALHHVAGAGSALAVLGALFTLL